MDPSAPAGATISAVLDRRRRGCRARCTRTAARAATASRRPRHRGHPLSRDPAGDARRRSRRARCRASSAATRCCGSSATTRSTASSSFREANAGVGALPALARRRIRRRAAGADRRSRRATRRGSRWPAPSTSPVSSMTRADRRSWPAWDAIEALGSGVYGNFSTSTDAAFAAKMYPPRRRWRGSRRSSASGTRRTSSPATTTCCRPEAVSDRRHVGEATRQCVSSASISVRSPDHRVWKVPSLSMRL